MKRFVLLALVVGLTGCVFDDPCSFGSCLESDAGEGGNGSTADAGQATDGATHRDASSNGEPNSNTPDAGTGPVDMAPRPDMAPEPDMASEPDMTSEPDSCVVDLFTFQCGPDPYEDNNQFAEHLGTIGCGPAHNVRSPMIDRTITPWICPLERADNFSLIVAECSTGPVELTLEFDVRTPCSVNLYEIFADAASCGSAGVTCTQTGNTFEFRWDAAVPRDAKVRNVTFGVRSFDDIFIDYEIRARSN